MGALSRIGLATALTAALGGCSLLVDTSGLGGGDVGSAPDGSTPDGSTATPSDGGSPAVDGGATDGASGGPCGPDQFCDDFDVGPFAARWTSKQTRRGSVELGKDALSPPGSLHAIVTSGSGQGYASLAKVYDTSLPRMIRCELDFKLVSTGLADVFEIQSRINGRDYYAYVGYSQQQWVVGEYSAASGGSPVVDRGTTIPPLPSGRWAHLVVTFDEKRISAGIDGRVVGELDQLTASGASRRTIAVGLTDVPSGAAAEAFTDNVVCTLAP